MAGDSKADFKPQVALSKVMDETSKPPAGKSAVAKSAVGAMAKTARADVVFKDSIAKSAIPAAPSGLEPPPFAGVDDDEEETDDEEEDDDAPTKTGSLAMPSNYVPPELKVGPLGSLFEETAKPGVGGVKKTMIGKKIATTMIGGKEVALMLAEKVAGGGKKKKKKKRRTKGMKGKQAGPRVMSISVTPGERENLQKLGAKGQEKRRSGWMKSFMGRCTQAKRRAACIGTLVLVVVIVAIVLGVHFGSSQTSTSVPSGNGKSQQNLSTTSRPLLTTSRSLPTISLLFTSTSSQVANST